MSPNTSALELAWTGVALLGIAVAVAFCAHVWVSYRAVQAWIAQGLALRWGPRHKFVLGFLIGTVLLVLIWLGFVLLGANAMTNAPPTTPDREAASERGGWILVGVEGVLFIFQAVLLGAWVAVGRPSLKATHEPPALAMLLIHAIDAGREMGHAVANDLQPAVAMLDEIATDASESPARRAEAAVALAKLDQVLVSVRTLHAEIKALEPRA